MVAQLDHRGWTAAGSSPAHQDQARSKNDVKPRLTANRGRRVVENDDYAAFARRILDAYARRVASSDVEALAQMTALAAELDSAIGQAVTGLRKCGYSWAEIGLRLGITRQAAQQRWGTSQRVSRARRVPDRTVRQGVSRSLADRPRLPRPGALQVRSMVEET